MKSIASTVVALCALACLSACGGGGGDGASSASAQGVAISSANQSTVASVVLNAAFSLGLVQGATGSGSGASVAGVSAATLRSAVQAAIGDQRRTIAAASVRPAATSSTSEACAVGGTLVTSFNDQDNNGQLSAGDVITAVFDHCQESSTLSINGTLVLTLTGTPSDTVIDAGLQFQNLVAVDGGYTYTFAGAVTFAETDTDTASSTSFTVGSGGLTVGIAAPSYSDTLSFDAGTVVSGNVQSGATSYSMSGSLTAKSIGGRVSVTMPQAFVQSSDAAYPASGQAVITGSGGGKLTVTALDATQAQLQLDANADGVIDGTTDVAWTALLP